MNSLRQIIGNTFDLVGGGGTFRRTLDESAITLYVLNALNDMELRLIHSGKAQRTVKAENSFPAFQRTGAFSATVSNAPEYIRYRYSGDNAINNSEFSEWRILPVAGDAEDLTRAENEGREMILITGVPGLFQYELSFTPQGTLEAEIWSKQGSNSFSSLDQAANFPPEYGHKAATDAAILAISDAIMTEEGMKFREAFAAKTQMLYQRKRELDYWFDVFCNRADDASATGQARDYDPFAEGGYGQSFE